VVRVLAVMAPATWRTEATMSSTVSSEVPCLRRMFSITTIESSTTRPTAIVRAPRVSMFRVKPPTHRPMRAISRERGMEIAATTVERNDPRNNRITTTAKRRPRPPSTERSWMDCSM
jgi:hypothetical protein